MTAWVRFVADDRCGLWKAGEIADDLGWESDHPDAPPIRCLRLPGGEIITLTDPFVRGLVAAVTDADAEPPRDPDRCAVCGGHRWIGTHARCQTTGYEGL